MQKQNFSKQPPFFDYREQDKQVAKANLEKIINDSQGMGGANSGWCYAIAPLRTFLTHPVFIRWIRKFKEEHYKDGTLELDANFLSKMYGQSWRKNQDLDNVIKILATLCKYTDRDGNMAYDRRECNYYIKEDGEPINRPRSVNHAGFIELLHTLFPYYGTGKTNELTVCLEDCMAIMTGSTDIIKFHLHKAEYEKGIIKGGIRNRIESQLDAGQCIAVNNDSETHLFNIYKKDNGYFILGSDKNEKNKQYNSIEEALKALDTGQGTMYSFSTMEESKLSNNKNHEAKQQYKYKMIEEYKEERKKNNIHQTVKFDCEDIINKIKACNEVKGAQVNNHKVNAGQGITPSKKNNENFGKNVKQINKNSAKSQNKQEDLGTLIKNYNTLSEQNVILKNKISQVTNEIEVDRNSYKDNIRKKNNIWSSIFLYAEKNKNNLQVMNSYNNFLDQHPKRKTDTSINKNINNGRNPNLKIKDDTDLKNKIDIYNDLDKINEQLDANYQKAEINRIKYTQRYNENSKAKENIWQSIQNYVRKNKNNKNAMNLYYMFLEQHSRSIQQQSQNMMGNMFMNNQKNNNNMKNMNCNNNIIMNPQMNNQMMNNNINMDNNMKKIQQMNGYINNYLQFYNSNVNWIKNHKLLTEAKEKYKAANGIKSKQVYNEIQRDTLNGYNKKLDMCKKQINENQKQMQILDYNMIMLCNQNGNLWNLYNQKIAVTKKTI